MKWIQYKDPVRGSCQPPGITIGATGEVRLNKSLAEKLRLGEAISYDVFLSEDAGFVGLRFHAKGTYFAKRTKGHGYALGPVAQLLRKCGCILEACKLTPIFPKESGGDADVIAFNIKALAPAVAAVAI